MLNPYQIALTKIPQLGAKSIRQLLKIYNTPEEVFSLSHAQLTEVFNKHYKIISAIESKEVLRQSEEEITELAKHHIDVLFFSEKEYPQHLNFAGCEDTPVLLYRLGQCDLNPHHAVAVVGSRKCTDYGRNITHQLIKGMISDKPLIVSGLAYGIDTEAHTAALDNQLPTIAILGHGLDIIYPNANRPLARRILDCGGALITEYPLHTAINPSYFPARNRIVAAMSDATVVVEASERGGALITANMANGYNREVFAVPGRLTDPASQGCNNLISNHKAIILRNAGDIYYQMGWQNPNFNNTSQSNQLALFQSLTPDQLIITKLLQEHREMTIDEMGKNCSLSIPKIAMLVMDLELKKVIYCLPGRLYKLA